ncbi:hypothetical protein NRZ30_03880 [Aeromonas jandaei]|uniref:hypothetical protein n=1 Tax=Aeromonas jandaei TaxID=650 RepID=UPI00227ABDFE|nr:hypothetical protein [Aeromonas jandaei]WAG08215.1 hypothetical protein NRZ30_03880 [Aeromonas jandaei]
MTTTHPSNVTALPGMQERPLVSDRMAAFMAEELLPMMAGSWPASANHLDANARGVVLAWGGVLRGFTPAQIREVVLDMAAEAERQFAPRPAEVRAEILRRLPPAVRTKPRQLKISIAACEMEATVIVLKRDGEVTREAVKIEMERILSDRRERGYTITGGL